MSGMPRMARLRPSPPVPSGWRPLMNRLVPSALALATVAALALSPALAQAPEDAAAQPPPPAQDATVQPPENGPRLPVDEAYGAFQRGFYLTALQLALPRAEKGDAKAQTLIAEIYARGL